MKKRYIILFPLVLLFIINNFESDQKTAIIIDSIGGDSGFTSSISKTLRENGYETDIVLGEKVTVNYLQNMPKQYKIYVLRVHSTCINNRTWIFTGEKYRSQGYPLMQMADLIHAAKISQGSDYYYAVSPEVFLQYEPSHFKHSIILMMGCEGLSSTDMAYTFCSRGAQHYVSWDGNVCLQHTDDAFKIFLSLFLENQSITESINKTSSIIGKDPVYFSSLQAYSISP